MRVEMVDHVGGDAVEGQMAGCPVQVHPDPTRLDVLGGHNLKLLSVPPGCVLTSIVAFQAPGTVVVSQDAPVVFLLAVDAFVGYADVGPLRPLQLPVAAPRQALLTQHLPFIYYIK